MLVNQESNVVKYTVHKVAPTVFSVVSLAKIIKTQKINPCNYLQHKQNYMIIKLYSQKLVIIVLF